MTIEDFPNSTLIHSTKHLTTIDAGYEANCHGYTITKEYTTKSNWREVIKYSDNLDHERILVYTYKKNISHSGRIEGKVLIHFVKGLGIVETPLDIARQVITEYKDGVFELPKEREQYNIHMKKLTKMN